MNSQHWKLLATYVGCGIIGLSQIAFAQNHGPIDAAAAVNTTASLPPPMPVSTETVNLPGTTVGTEPSNIPVPGFTPQPGLPPQFPLITPDVTPVPLNTTPAVAVPTVTPIPQSQPHFDIPGLESSSNFNGAQTLGNISIPASPVFVAPSVLTPNPDGPGIESLKNIRALEKKAANVNRMDEPVSAFGTPNPPETLNYYVSPRLETKPEPAGGPVVPMPKDIIVLTSGQEFSGEVLLRGNEWRIRLINGSVISVPGNKVSHFRKVLENQDTFYKPRTVQYTPKPLYMKAD